MLLFNIRYKAFLGLIFHFWILKWHFVTSKTFLFVSLIFTYKVFFFNISLLDFEIAFRL
jgi:hypothetical protein